MFANASDTYLDILLPENRMYGFAISQALDAVLPDRDCSGIHNQPQATSYEEGKPQGIERMWGSDELPDIRDFYAWSLKVFIEPDKDFNQQLVHLTHTTETTRDEEEVWLCATTRVMTLRALLHLLRQPKDAWGMLLGCFEFNDDECADYVVPTSELLDKS
tara:strand:- start:101 stop:583 length:483 start_codon:yes stop_codon:yes gene_type:complete